MVVFVVWYIFTFSCVNFKHNFCQYGHLDVPHSAFFQIIDMNVGIFTYTSVNIAC